MDIAEFARRIPKIELHLHLEGSVQPATFLKMARKNGVPVPPFREVSDLYVYNTLPEFLVIYNLVSRSMVDADDFHLTTYEALASSASGNGRHLEFFFSPHAHLEHGVAYSTMLDGITAAMRDAEKDHGITSRLIPAHSRELGVERGLTFLDMVLADRRDEVIGIGLDYNEAPHPPAPFMPLYDRARAAGLRLTAHAGENGTAAYVRDAIDVLKVDRVDHGYRVVEDTELFDRCLSDGIYFTCCPSASRVITRWTELSPPDHAIKRMIDGGLNVTINSDDPPMFETDLANEFVRVATEMKLTPAQLKSCALNSISASWLDESEKRTLRSDWAREIDELMAKLAPPGGKTLEEMRV